MATLVLGDKLEVEFEVNINKFTVVDLNSGKEKLEDILILHLVGGKKCCASYLNI